MNTKSDKQSDQAPASPALRDKLNEILGPIHIVNGDDIEQCRRLESDIIGFIAP